MSYIKIVTTNRILQQGLVQVVTEQQIVYDILSSVEGNVRNTVTVQSTTCQIYIQVLTQQQYANKSNITKKFCRARILILRSSAR